MTNKSIVIMRVRLQGESDKPWIYFHGDNNLPLSHMFCNFNRVLLTQKSILVGKSVMDKPVKKQIRLMFEKLFKLQYSNSLAGLEIELINRVSIEERLDGMTAKMWCIRRTSREAVEWLLTNNHKLQNSFTSPGITPETVATLTNAFKQRT